MTRFFRTIFDQARLVPYHEVSRLPQTVSAVGVCAPTLLRREHTYARCDGHEPYHNLEEIFEDCLDVGHHTTLAGRRLGVGWEMCERASKQVQRWFWPGLWELVCWLIRQEVSFATLQNILHVLKGSRKVCGISLFAACYSLHLHYSFCTILTGNLLFMKIHGLFSYKVDKFQ